jgi:hypothetical protein
VDVPSDEELGELYAAKNVLEKRVVQLAELHRQRLLAVRGAQETYMAILPLCEATRGDAARVEASVRAMRGHEAALEGACQVRRRWRWWWQRAHENSRGDVCRVPCSCGRLGWMPVDVRA